MIETHYKLDFRLQMLHKSIVYDLYEMGWQTSCNTAKFCTCTVNPKVTHTCTIYTYNVIIESFCCVACTGNLENFN